MCAYGVRNFEQLDAGLQEAPLTEELGIDIVGKRGSSKALVDALNAYLLDAYGKGLKVVLLIDEAQNLPADALEQVRLLTNLETDTQKLLQILLLGQPELRTMLARPELRQLAQRITARFHLDPLQPGDTASYLRHRWRVAGGERFPFDAKAVQRLHARAGGIPRLINVIAERALLAGYARDANRIDARLVDLAANEVLPPTPAGRAWPWLATAAAVIAIAAFASWTWQRPARPSPGAAAAVPAPAAVVAEASAPTAPGPGIQTLDATGLTQLLGATGDTPLPAWRHLLALWKLPAQAITVDPAGPCTSVHADVHCVDGGSARLDPLLALDRPLLLRLQGGGASAWALLLGADARTARVRIGERVVDIDRVLLLSHWSGDYATLWRGPSILRTPPRPGDSGAAVEWVRARLGAADNAGAVYDATLRQAVRTLQDARGLPADGIAGPLTLMALADDANAPRLRRTLD